MSDPTDEAPVQTMPGEYPEGFDPNDHGEPIVVVEPEDPPRSFTTTASPDGSFSATEGKAGTFDGFFINYGDSRRFLPKDIAEEFARFILNE